MKFVSLFSLLTVSLVASAGISVAAEKTEIQTSQAQSAIAQPLVVAELFTSQGCSSCPPAERLFSTLADDDNLLTMEWHVDVWDNLVHGGSRWKDVYSNKENTTRQRAYNRSIRGKSALYTPQAIVNGHFEGVGSRPNEVSDMIKNAPALSVDVTIESGAVSVAPSRESADVVFVRLLKQHETNVVGGENKGHKLAGKNIVLDAQILGQTGADAVEFNLPSVKGGETCAVLVQNLDGTVGPILGAAKCL